MNAKERLIFAKIVVNETDFHQRNLISDVLMHNRTEVSEMMIRAAEPAVRQLWKLNT